MEATTKKIKKGFIETIGNTPLIRIESLSKETFSIKIGRKKTKCYEKILEHCETVAADCISRFFETGKINASGKFIPSETENCENTNNIESNSPRQLLF